MLKKIWWPVISILVLVGIVLGACGPDPTAEVIEKEVVVTQVVEVEKTVVVDGEVKTETVVETVEVVVTPTAVPEKPLTSKEPDTLYDIVGAGDTDTLDPAWNYENAGDSVILNVYDQLVTYDGGNPTAFVPSLATDWEVSDDGQTYTFHIREGVTFHDGADLTPEDVAYTFQRGILQGGYDSPQWLYTEALFGTGVYDIAELVDPEYGDDPQALQDADPDKLMEVCQMVTDAIVADADAGTVTFNLIQSWAPLIPTLAGSWGSIIDKDWSIEHGTWDGDCATWQNYYGVTSANAPLRDVMNGTGPYTFDHWVPGEETVLVKNPEWWRTVQNVPAFEGAPTEAGVDRVVRRLVTEWGTRYAMIQAGDADYVYVPRQNVAQVDPLVGELCEWDIEAAEFNCAPTENPKGMLRLYMGHPNVARTDAFFVFDINVDGGNPYVGSGELDGNGIPSDFFSDIHVRRAFNYCFDWDTYIRDALEGEAVQSVGYMIPGMIGYDVNGPHYSFDLDKCAEELQLAWDGQVWENGFRMQIGYNTGNLTRQTLGQILQDSFSTIDPKFQIELIGLPWPSFLDAVRNSRIPIFLSAWVEDLHDPHNWAQPFLAGYYALRQGMPDEMLTEFSDLVSEGVGAPTVEERAEIYRQLTQLDYEYAPAIRLAVATGRHYEPRWMKGWYYNPIYGDGSTSYHYYTSNKE